MKALSVDLRRRVVEAVAACASCRAATARFEVGVSSAIRWGARRCERQDALRILLHLLENGLRRQGLPQPSA